MALIKDYSKYFNKYSFISPFRAGGANSNTQWDKIKKWVLVEGRTGSMFIAELIEMNLLHILNLELTKLQLLPIKTT